MDRIDCHAFVFGRSAVACRLADNARLNFTHRSHSREVFALGRVRNIASEFLQERSRALEGLPCGCRSISGHEEPRERKVIAPFDERHGVIDVRLEGARQFFFRQILIAARRCDFA